MSGGQKTMCRGVGFSSHPEMMVQPATASKMMYIAFLTLQANSSIFILVFLTITACQPTHRYSTYDHLLRSVTPTTPWNLYLFSISSMCSDISKSHWKRRAELALHLLLHMNVTAGPVRPLL